ncbi:hypothetical protein QJS10_CPB21g01443 [Acorus calamus]|uniref:Reverse transcriptase zinc-binding domain-containing protein n=1 Tax=Acorus calamus TaxID=4465 RepID=A0AAV9C517_ACOCL|nr:hypothetical protein QJS10_CPB21g01443 [Acorus calamus]
MADLSQSEMRLVGAGRLNAWVAKVRQCVRGYDQQWRAVDSMSGAYSLSVVMEEIWNGILSATACFVEAFGWDVGNGRAIRFWHDQWVGDTPLKSKFPEIFTIAADKDGLVEQFWTLDSEGGWVIGLQRAPEDGEVEFLYALTRELQGKKVCNGGVESTSHIMVECPLAKQVWQRLASMTGFREGSSSLEELWGEGKCLRPRGDKGAKSKVQGILLVRK